MDKHEQQQQADRLQNKILRMSVSLADETNKVKELGQNVEDALNNVLSALLFLDRQVNKAKISARQQDD